MAGPDEHSGPQLFEARVIYSRGCAMEVLFW